MIKDTGVIVIGEPAHAASIARILASDHIPFAVVESNQAPIPEIPPLNIPITINKRVFSEAPTNRAQRRKAAKNKRRK